jgi:hypothetical protein
MKRIVVKLTGMPFDPAYEVSFLSNFARMAGEEGTR